MNSLEHGATAPTLVDEPASLVEHCKTTMNEGSKSFSLAALLFDKESAEAARYLYSWCRYCDDAVDHAPTKDSARAALEQLKQDTSLCFRDSRSAIPAFAAFHQIAVTYGIKEEFALDLLAGMRMDVDGYNYRTLADLELYCYRVAGVVGLMMVQIMRVGTQDALVPAVDTGLAMQMTNIARDIKEDFAMGRIYIPETMFAARKLSRPSTDQKFNPSDFVYVTRDLLQLAEKKYASGRKGLRYLPFRAALAVSAAQFIYREIGREVHRKGLHAWQTRTVVPMYKKIALLIFSAGVVIVEKIKYRLASKL